VEAGLRQLAGVADAAASVVQAGGAARLAGHLVLQDARPAGLDEAVSNLRNELAGRVSAHLVPALWSVMDVLPLTTHGKVDRKALPDGAQLRPASASGHRIVRAGGPASGDSASGAPVGEISAIAAAMARVLGRSEVGPDDGFFALGGDSVLVISLVSELRAGGHEVEVRDIYRHRTPRELVDASVATGRGGPSAPPASAADDDTGESLLRLDDNELAALEAELGF
jgi:hypothetical protein